MLLSGVLNMVLLRYLDMTEKCLLPNSTIVFTNLNNLFTTSSLYKPSRHIMAGVSIQNFSKRNRENNHCNFHNMQIY